MTLGQEFEAYSITVEKCAQWIEEGRNQLRELGIGGSAAGTGLTVPRGYTKKIVQELKRLTQEELTSAENLCEAMQSQSPLTYYSSMLRLTALELTRICNDLRLLASGPLTGLAEIYLPAVQPGSSIMPGKVNPSILEMANQTWFSVLGYDHTIAYSAQAGQLELNVMMPIMAYSALEATHVATQALKILRTKCIEGLMPNEARLLRYFESTPQIATALSPKLGYDNTAKLVKEALEKGISVLDLVREKKLLSEKDLKLLLNTRTLTGL
jgi:aspartate ammonia-lyase